MKEIGYCFCGVQLQASFIEVYKLPGNQISVVIQFSLYFLFSLNFQFFNFQYFLSISSIFFLESGMPQQGCQHM